jgi:hypothetical protein
MIGKKLFVLAAPELVGPSSPARLRDRCKVIFDMPDLTAEDKLILLCLVIYADEDVANEEDTSMLSGYVHIFSAKSLEPDQKLVLLYLTTLVAAVVSVTDVSERCSLPRVTVEHHLCEFDRLDLLTRDADGIATVRWAKLASMQRAASERQIDRAVLEAEV